MKPQSTASGWVRYTVELLIVVVLFAAAGFVWFNKQYLTDQVAAWNYQPSSQMSTIKNDLSLTGKGSLYFDASQPVIESAKDFNTHCNQQQESRNPILGCYVNYRIYVYDVTNAKLSGIEQTTAAHELLHAAYSRLSASQKDKLKPLLLEAYKAVKTPELEDRIDYYHQNEPGEEMNELHSILGSEFADLGPKLDEYYQQYFKNRSAVVAYHDRYEAVFQSLTARATSLKKQIDSLVATINAEIKQYNADVAQLNADVADFKRRNDAGEFTSTGQFYSERNALVARSNELAARKQTIEANIATYNRLRAQYNAIATETNNLNKSINSTLAPTSTL